ncbi:MAG TPA: hypothetical protein VGE10_10500 [Zeimonas sp.]
MLVSALLLGFSSRPCYLHFEGTERHTARLYANPSAALRAFKKDARRYQPLGLFLRAWIYLAEDMGLGVQQPSFTVYRELAFLGNGKVACYRLNGSPRQSWPISKQKGLPDWTDLRKVKPVEHDEFA